MEIAGDSRGSKSQEAGHLVKKNAPWRWMWKLYLGGPIAKKFSNSLRRITFGGWTDSTTSSPRQMKKKGQFLKEKSPVGE